jgi:2'-5' RNA ligase
MNELIRAFVAVEVPESVRNQAGALVRSIPSVLGVRWVRPEAMHLTLAFLGEQRPDFIESAKTALAPVGLDHSRFKARLSGLGAFPNPKRARVVWAGMNAGQDEVCRLQRAVVAALVRIGFVPESRKFSPHLTLGRLKVPADVSAVTAVRFESDLFPVDRFVLFRSELRPEGPRYSRLGDYPLSGQSPLATSNPAGRPGR